MQAREERKKRKEKTRAYSPKCLMEAVCLFCLCGDCAVSPSFFRSPCSVPLIPSQLPCRPSCAPSTVKSPDSDLRFSAYCISPLSAVYLVSLSYSPAIRQLSGFLLPRLLLTLFQSSFHRSVLFYSLFVLTLRSLPRTLHSPHINFTSFLKLHALYARLSCVLRLDVSPFSSTTRQRREGVKNEQS